MAPPEKVCLGTVVGVHGVRGNVRIKSFTAHPADVAAYGAVSDESGAHPEYKRRLIGAAETVLTELFGAGWPAPHRVVPNDATARWLRADPRGPEWVRALHRATAPVLARLPEAAQQRMAASQTPSRPLRLAS